MGIQFVVEAFLSTLFAAKLAVGMAVLCLPILNGKLGTDIHFKIFHDVFFWVWFTVIVILGSLISGLYPTFIASSFDLVGMINSTIKKRDRGFGLRKGLMLFQFFMSLLLILETYVVIAQISFMKAQDLVVDMEKILVLHGPEVGMERRSKQSKIEIFKDILMDKKGIVDVSGSVPGKGFNLGAKIRIRGENSYEDKTGYFVFADNNFFSTYGLQLVSGRTFLRNVPTDHEGVELNEETIRILGFSSPEFALYQKLITEGSSNDTLTILGVVRNVHWNSLKEAHMPYLFKLESERLIYFSLKMDFSDIEKSIHGVEATYQSVFPSNPFDYFFLDDEFINRQYKSDLEFGRLFFLFKLLAILISSVGLFTIVSFSSSLKLKEIGIRKVLGVKSMDLVILLSGEFVILIIKANILAVPLIFVVGRLWLQAFAFRVNLSVDMLLVPGFVLLIA